MSLVCNIAYRKKKKVEPVADIDYLYFTSAEPFSVTLSGQIGKIWNQIEYSKDKLKWSILDHAQTVSGAANETIYYRGTNNSSISKNTTGDWHESNRFSFTGTSIECGGNIETLLDYEKVSQNIHPMMDDGCFIMLFANCTALISAPKLPALILSKECYGGMFYYCTSLILPSALPATSLAYGCYYQMFEGCTSLISISALPAKTLNQACYLRMFQGCTSLSIVQDIDNNHQIPYTIPYQQTLSGSVGQYALDRMFQFNESTPSSTTDTPTTETTYYVYSVIEPDGTILTSQSTPAHIYGVMWDNSSQTGTTKWIRGDEAKDFADPVPYIAGATEYGSPFDNIYPWKDMTIVEDVDVGTMVKIPKFWYKLEHGINSNIIHIQIADKAVDGYSVCPACMDRGDGKGERDYILVGRYHCGTDLKSVASNPAVNMTRSEFRTGIQNLGNNIYMMDWATRFTIFLLYLVEFADWNSQDKIGYGCGNGSSTGVMGYTDLMPYHTGTTRSSRTAFGLGTQYRYIEGLWDNVWDWIDGCYNSSAGLNIILDPTKFSDNKNGINVGTPTHGYPSKFYISNIVGSFPLFIPSESSGSTTSHSCDYWSFDKDYPCICVGGLYSQQLSFGLFYFMRQSTFESDLFIGSRVMKL